MGLSMKAMLTVSFATDSYAVGAVQQPMVEVVALVPPPAVLGSSQHLSWLSMSEPEPKATLRNVSN
eukprot:11221131-Lingulodinium_polyedra.AAC.1